MPDGPQTAQQRAPVAATRWDPAANAWTTSARGRAVLSEPRINKGVAFPPAERRALYDRFAYSQRFARIDPWAERVAGRHAEEFNPLSRRLEVAPA